MKAAVWPVVRHRAPPRVSGERIKGERRELPVQGEGPSAGALGWEPGGNNCWALVCFRVRSCRLYAWVLCRDFPSADYYADSATPRTHQPTSGLAGPPPTARRTRGASHVHHDPFDRVGSRLYPLQRLRRALAVSRRPPRPGRQAGRGASRRKSGRIVAVDDPCPPRFGSCLKSRSFYHRIAFALPFGLASTHAAVWQCRPAVTSSGRFAPQRAIPRPVGPQLLRAAASARGRHHSRHG